MKLDLSNVTLLFVETRAHKITARVIEDCTSKVNFGGILLYTDKPDLIPVAEGGPPVRRLLVPDFPDKKTAGQFYYQYAMREVKTDFALMLEWDGGIKDISRWTPEFFEYDYIGAPWNVRPQEINRLDVGNGGFMMMSRKLGHFLAENQKTFPVFTDWDVSRTQRGRLENEGFKWPKRDLASRFSWELTQLPPEGVFGFHATFTWPWMLERSEVITRARLMTETPYLMSKMHDLLKKAPWLEDELGPEFMIKYREVNPHAGPLPRNSQGRIMTVTERRRMNQILTQRRALYLSQQQNRSGLKA